MYTLVVFYHVFAKEPAPHKLHSKFKCIKGIFFLLLYSPPFQNVANIEHIQEAIRNVLVCLEMVFFSVLQQYAFHHDVETKMRLRKKKK
ncbi:hypothetical protein RJ640_025934 [Escallonia rubra]|uniref:Uncharacterized protein n=1 Tax=Escallonia rubra TaxID=112253 RepID=A0AA88RTB4_9ASTE|nr:hypothetical protein RJ640_025934 [Escallonia rubra]